MSDSLSSQEPMAPGNPLSADSVAEGSDNGLLNQEEMNSLLELSLKKGAISDSLEAFLNPGGLVSCERLPMLEVIFDRFTLFLRSTLQHTFSENLGVQPQPLLSFRFEEYLNTLSCSGLWGVGRIKPWDGPFLMFAEDQLVYTFLETVLGGGRSPVALSSRKPFTTLEQTLVGRVFSLILTQLTKAFSLLFPVTCVLDHLEPNQSFARTSGLIPLKNTVVLMRLEMDIEDKKGNLDFLVPYSTLEPGRKELLQKFMGEKFGHDPLWENHFKTELWDTEIIIEAILESIPVTLGEAMSWRVGSFIPLKERPDSDIQVTCGNSEIFQGRMGQKNGHVAIQIGKITLTGRDHL